MLEKGPIPRFVHGLLEYVVGALLIASPFLFGFDSSAATALAVVTGVVVIALAALTEGASGLVDQVPVPVHALLDVVIAVVLIASPFALGFSEEGAPTALVIVLGVLHLLVSIGTRFAETHHHTDYDGIGTAI